MRIGDKMYLISDGRVSTTYVHEVGFGRGNGFSLIRADGAKAEDGMPVQDVYEHFGFAFGCVYSDGVTKDVYCVRHLWHYPFCRLAKWIYSIKTRFDLWVITHKNL